MFHALIFAITFLLTVVVTEAVRRLALRSGVVDKPGLWRKIHKRSVPLLGGIAIFVPFFIVLYFVRERLLAGNLEPHHWVGFFVGAFWLVLGGYLDDKYDLKPQHQVIFPLLAALSAVAGGIEIEKITHPLGGLLYLDRLRVPVAAWGGSMHYFTVVSDTFIIAWLMGMMYTTKLLDGIDGLVTGVTAIGALVIFLFTMTTRYFQPDIGLAALVLAGSCLGFLVFNRHPAGIFLGEGGSLLLGYILGVLAIISGGKIAIALLVMGIPIMDVAWAIIRRLAAGKNPFKFADRLHLHFRLLDLGLGQRQTVLVYYALAAVFGLSALFLQSTGKLLALAILILVMFGFVAAFTFNRK